MEEQYKKVTAIITRLAAENPHITKEQIAKAKSMYNGDDRPIEEIEAELVAYSQNIAASANKVVEEKIEAPTIEDTPSMPLPNTEPEPEPEKPQEIYEPLKVSLPGDDKKKELQQMINDALGDMPTVPERTAAENNNNNEKPKQFVKKETQPADTQNSEAGYGNVIALLTLTIMFSIVTIVMAVFTILIN